VPDLTHVRVNVSPTAERVLSRRENDALARAARTHGPQKPPATDPAAEEES